MEIPRLITAACHTDKGRVRSINEDASLILDLVHSAIVDSLESFPVDQGSALLAVADGMGGANAGEVASQLAIEQMVRRLTAPSQSDNSQSRLSDAIKSANRAIRREAQEASAKAGMGTTITAILVNGNRGNVGQVGDSRAYLIRGDTMEQLTKDQSLVQLLVDAGQLTEEEAIHSQRRNVILQALGAQDDVTPDMSELFLENGDTILLCTDYLMQKVTKSEVLELVQKNASIDDVCRALVSLANERGGEDNITALMASFSG